MPDQQLNLGKTDRDTDGWASVFDAYAHRGVRFAYSLLHNQSDAEEIVQESFCRLLASPRWRRRCAVPQNVGPALFKTIRNLCIDELRRRPYRRAAPLDHINRLPARAVRHHLQHAEGQANETETAVRVLISQLPENWRAALSLRVDADLSYAEIAQLLGCTQPQVRTWIYRARRQLADGLRRDGILAEKGATHESV